MTIFTAICLLIVGFAAVVSTAFYVMTRSGYCQPADMGLGEWETGALETEPLIHPRRL